MKIQKKKGILIFTDFDFNIKQNVMQNIFTHWFLFWIHVWTLTFVATFVAFDGNTVILV